MKNDLFGLVSNKNKKIEIAIISLISLFFFAFFYKLLSGQSLLSHDSIRWYGVYNFLGDSLLHGIFPYWDPYDFCGQPFYYNLGILRFHEPITIFFIFLNKLFSTSILTLYHWEYLARIWFVGLGVYLCFKQINKYVLSNLIVFGVFLFSSFTVTCFRQNGVLYTFFWVPWVIYFLLRLLKNFNFYNIIGVSFFIGLSLSSYQGVYTLIYLFIFILTLLINNRKFFVSIFKSKKNLAYIFIGALLIIVLALPLLTVAIEQNKIVPTARLDDKVDITEGVSLSFSSVEKGGTHSNIADFLELIFPVVVKGYFWGWFPSSGFGLSECFLYIGLLPLLLAIIGIIKPKGNYRINFLITLITIGLLMLGPKGIVYILLYLIFPPLRLARHMHLFAGFFIFTLFYFVGQGADYILDKFLTEADNVK